MQKHSLLLASVLAIAVAVPAQSFLVPTGTTPDVGTVNAFPFNTTSMRYQALVMASDLGSVPALLTGFAIAPSATGVRTFQQVTMKMAHTSLTTLTTTFDTNLVAPITTTMDVTNWSWHKTLNVWNPVDFQTPFLFNGVDNVVVEFLVIGSAGANIGTRRDATHQRVYQGSYTGQPTGTNGGLTAFKMRFYNGDAQVGSYGSGCVGASLQAPLISTSGSATLGSTLNIDLANAPSTTPAVLHIGSTSATPFPLDLTLIGATGCSMYTDVLVALAVPTSPAGTSTFALNVPNNPGLTRLTLYFQWAVVDAGANPFGLTTTGYARAQFGN